MNPVEPRTDRFAPNWKRVIYAEHQPEYIPLPTLQETRRDDLTSEWVPQRVVSVWEPDDTELSLLMAMIARYRHANGPRPRISLMLHTFGQPLQPIRLVVGEFSDPYQPGSTPVEPSRDGSHGRERAFDASGRFEQLNAEVTGASPESGTAGFLKGENVPWKEDRPPGPPDPPPTKSRPVG